MDWQAYWLILPRSVGQPKQDPLLHTCPGAQHVLPQTRFGSGQHTLFTQVPAQHWPLQHGLNGGQHLLLQMWLGSGQYTPFLQSWGAAQTPPQQICPAVQHSFPQFTNPVGQPQLPSGEQLETFAPQHTLLHTTMFCGQHRSPRKQLSCRPQQVNTPPHGTGQHPPPGNWHVPQHASQITLYAAIAVAHATGPPIHTFQSLIPDLSAARSPQLFQQLSQSGAL
ncbi:hypothetical protein [Terriglobus aquaticus]|uniref:Uncharacterized protein n=1 Tax=Terriglobus aquaticus TaxID=940139 RepID=A0ABW9KFJ5_9BACT|nr:hypothetical protein [Terriglobus aquaticus]